MARDEVEPTITVEDRGGTRYEHPAYGQISVGRRQGGHYSLYGTEFLHNNTIAIKLTTSTMYRDLSRDWHHEGKVIAEVILSEAQWATLVSSLNSGGVPATIAFSEGGGVRPAIAPRNTEPLYRKEGEERIASVVAQLDLLRAKIEAATSGISKKKTDELLEHIRVAKQDIESNVGFVAKSFGEHMEHIVSQAKVEVEAHINSAIQRAGLQALQQGEPFLQLTAPDNSEGT